MWNLIKAMALFGSGEFWRERVCEWRERGERYRDKEREEEGVGEKREEKRNTGVCSLNDSS